MTSVRSRKKDADDELDEGEGPAADHQVGRDLFVAQRSEAEEVEDFAVVRFRHLLKNEMTKGF